MKTIRYLTLVISVLPTMAFACQCNEIDINNSYNESAMVVYANVQDFIPAPSGEGGTAIIIIKHWWKSSSPERVAVNSLTNCNLDFEIGSSYLLFLGMESNGLYYADKCSGSKILTFNNEYSKTLKNIKNNTKK